MPLSFNTRLRRGALDLTQGFVISFHVNSSGWWVILLLLSSQQITKCLVNFLKQMYRTSMPDLVPRLYCTYLIKQSSSRTKILLLWRGGGGCWWEISLIRRGEMLLLILLNLMLLLLVVLVPLMVMLGVVCIGAIWVAIWYKIWFYSTNLKI